MHTVEEGALRVFQRHFGMSLAEHLAARRAESVVRLEAEQAAMEVSETLALSWAYDIATAVKAMHETKLLHGALCPATVYLLEPSPLVVKDVDAANVR